MLLKKIEFLLPFGCNSRVINDVRTTRFKPSLLPPISFDLWIFVHGCACFCIVALLLCRSAEGRDVKTLDDHFFVLHALQNINEIQDFWRSHIYGICQIFKQIQRGVPWVSDRGSRQCVVGVCFEERSWSLSRQALTRAENQWASFWKTLFSHHWVSVQCGSPAWPH